MSRTAALQNAAASLLVPCMQQLLMSAKNNRAEELLAELVSECKIR